MSYLVCLFAWLMDWCHSWCPNYWADIVIFTFITKVIQFPLSLWCQNNALKMVALMPESNRIKMEYYGDQEAIGDATANLFKARHYHPMLALVPLAIQIVILMAFVKVIYRIGDKLTIPGCAKPLIACVPVSDGGISWVMPFFAGAAAWLLGYSQNVFNPLQHEQSRKEQIVTNGISICISLFLGMFVATGVGLYWATSNFFSIVVQWCENWCIPPEKYVNYCELRRSQSELRKFEDSITSHGNVSVADKRREKVDYKRFFKIVNKHLVFYSEGAGFYKYFKPIIDWLLSHTNIVIHYVTNDPKDPILFQVNSRVKGYYIGPVKIIPLFMKMDADMVVMTTPDLNTYQLKRSYVRKDVEYIYVDHGTSSIHMVFRKGAFDHFDTVFIVGKFMEREHRKIEELYKLKPKRLIPVGYPYLGTLLSNSHLHLKPNGTQILIAPSYQKDNILDLCLDDMLASISSLNGVKIILRPHPQYVRRNPARWQEIKEKLVGVAIDDDFSNPPALYESDVLISDWSSIAFEFSFVTKRPTILINTPPKIINPDYERIGVPATDITFREWIGETLEPKEVSRVAGVVKDMLEHPDKYRARIESIFTSEFYDPLKSGEVAGKYILDSLIERRKMG